MQPTLYPVIVLQSSEDSGSGQPAARVPAEISRSVSCPDMSNGFQRLDGGAPNHFSGCHVRTPEFQSQGIVEESLGCRDMLPGLHQDFTDFAKAERDAAIRVTSLIARGNSSSVQANSGS